MTKRRSSEQWRQVLSEFESSGENATAFCRNRGISTSNFYKHKSSHESAPSSAFVVARRAAPATTPMQSLTQLSVQINDVTIRCDEQTSVAWLSELIAAVRR